MSNELNREEKSARERVAPTHEEIEVRAYELYQDCGCDGGHDVQHWLEAERQLSAPGAQVSMSSVEPQQKAAAAGRQNN